MNPTTLIVNSSRSISDADVKRHLVALQKQITRDFEPAWGWGANLVFDASHFNMKIVIRDHAASGDLGYHIEGDKPVGYIFAADDIEDAGEYTSTLSHELLEMIADHNVNLYAAGTFNLWNKIRVCFFSMDVSAHVMEQY